MRLADRSGSMAAENAIIENCGTRRNPIRMVIRLSCHISGSPAILRALNDVAVDHRDVVFALDFGQLRADYEEIMDPNRRRQGGRGRRLDGSRVPQLPWTQVRNTYLPMELLSADQIEAIHLTSLRILEDLGMEGMSPRAVAVLKAAGAQGALETRTVRVERGLVENALTSAPKSFVLTPRSLAKRVTMGGNHVNFGLVAGPPNVHDCERGRRPGNYRDYCDFIRLAQYFNAIHLIGNQGAAAPGTTGASWTSSASRSSSTPSISPATKCARPSRCLRIPGIWTRIWRISSTRIKCFTVRRSAPDARSTASG